MKKKAIVMQPKEDSMNVNRKSISKIVHEIRGFWKNIIQIIYDGAILFFYFLLNVISKI